MNGDGTCVDDNQCETGSVCSGGSCVPGRGSAGRPDARVLRAGDELLLFAINHATGYAGMKTVIVPEYQEGATDIPEIVGDIRLFPPEIEVTVERQLAAHGVPTPKTPSRIREGGAATQQDEFLKVSTRWRVRLAPHIEDDVIDGGVRLPGFTLGRVNGADAGFTSDLIENNIDAGVLAGEPSDAGFVDGGPVHQTSALLDEGTAGLPLERPCAGLDEAATARERLDCLNDETTLTDVPVGIPPLAGRIVRLAGVASTDALFQIRGGPASQQLMVARDLSSTTKALPVLNGLHLIHVVGRPLRHADTNGDGTLSEAEAAVGSSAITSDVPLQAGAPDFHDESGKHGFPEKAIAIKAIYDARLRPEDGGPTRKVPSFDLTREHRFRMVSIDAAEVRAGDTTTNRELEQDDEKAHANEGDDVFSLIVAMLDESIGDQSGRDFSRVGDYEVRLGGDEMGVDCALTVDAQGANLGLRSDCAGDLIDDVLSAHDVVYLELFHSGNADNVLYRYNFYGLLARVDVPAVQNARTSDLATRPNTAAGQRPEEAAISRKALAIFYLDPSEIRVGLVKVCSTEPCTASSLLKEIDVVSYDDQNHSYVIADPKRGSVKDLVEQLPSEGVGGARYFALPLPADMAEMPGAATAPKQVHLTYVRQEPSGSPIPRPFGIPRGVYDSAAATAAGQLVLMGVNLADGHVVRDIEDFTLPEKGVTRGFGRTYNNQRNEVGPLGPGWMHSLEAFIHEEEPGRYQVVIGGQAFDFPKCNVLPEGGGAVESISGCVAAKNHSAALTIEVTSSLVSPTTYDTFTATVDTGTGTKLVFAKRSTEHFLRGDRRYYLSSIDDPLTVPIVLSYIDGTDLVEDATRAGGLSLTFEYAEIDRSDVRLAHDVKKKRAMKRLRRVLVDMATTPVVELLFDHDVSAVAQCPNSELPPPEAKRAMNLVGSCRKVRGVTADGTLTAPLVADRSMTYAYESPQPRATFSSFNELTDERWRVEPSGELVTGYGFTRLGDAGRSPYPQLLKTEVVASAHRLGEGYSFGYPTPNTRDVTWPVGGKKLIEMNAAGAPTYVETPCGSSTIYWDNDAIGGKTTPNGVRASTGHESSVRTNDKLEIDEMAVVTLPSTQAAVTGLGNGTKSTVLERDVGTRVPVRTSNPGAGGNAQRIEPTASQVTANGIVKRRSLGAEVYTEDVDPEGVVLTKHGLERVVEYLDPSEFGLPTRVAVACQPGSCSPGSLDGYETLVRYDGLGRAIETSQPLLTRAVTTNRFDGFDRPTLHRLVRGPTIDDVATGSTDSVETSYSVAEDGALTVTETEVRSGLPPAAAVTVTRRQEFTKTGLLKRTVDEMNAATEYNYEANECRLATVVSQKATLRESTQTQIYDSQKNLIGTKDEDLYGRRVDTEFDQLGLASKVTWTRTTGQATTTEAVEHFRHDVYGNLVEHRFGDGHIVAYRYSYLGELLRTESAAGSKGGKNDEIVWRDGEGKVREHKNALGMVESYRYDVLGRIAHVERLIPSIKNQGTGTTSGNLSYVETRSYNDLLSPTTQTVESVAESSLRCPSSQPTCGLADRVTTTVSELDDFDRPARVLNGSGVELVRYAYQEDLARNLLSSASTEGGETTTRTYLANGNATVSHPGGVSETIDTNARGLVQRSLLTGGPGGAVTTTYRYDGQSPNYENRQAGFGTVETSRTYDDDGRMLTETVVEGPVIKHMTTEQTGVRKQRITTSLLVGSAPEHISFRTIEVDGLGNPIRVDGSAPATATTRVDVHQEHFYYADGSSLGLNPDASNGDIVKIAFIDPRDGEVKFTKSDTYGLCVDTSASGLKSLIPVYGSYREGIGAFGCSLTNLLEDEDYVGAYINYQKAGFYAATALADVFGGLAAKPATLAGTTAVRTAGRSVAGSTGRLLIGEATNLAEHAVAGSAARAGAKVGVGSGSRRTLQAAATKVEQLTGCAGGLCGVIGKKCFVAGTEILLADGARVAIEDITVGDVVMSWDEATGATVQRHVTQTFVTPSSEVMSVVLDDEGVEEVVTATPDHPWYVDGRGWTATSELEVGDLVPSVHAGYVRVGSTTWEQERATVFNFEVEGTHTYFVGESAALVHNTCAIDNAIFGKLDRLGRPTGVDVVLDAGSLGTGTYGRIPRGLPIPGWGSAPGLSRGHVLGRQFRSPGRDARNVFAQFRKANEGRMSQLEDAVAAAVRNGDEVRYSVKLHYAGDNPIARGATIRALGRNVDIFETVLNIP